MRLTVAAAVACLIGGVSIADDARAAIRRPTYIPAQNLGEALQALAKDCNVQVVYFSTAIDVLKTSGAAGQFTTEEAFEKVLSGTGYTYRYLGDKTITIVPVSGGSPPKPGNTQAPPREPQASSFWSRFRLAQADTTDASVARRAAPESAPRPKTEIEEVVVTGSHIRGVPNPTMPVTILDKEYIDSTGLSTTTRLIESLPQNFALSNQSTSSGSGLLSGTSVTVSQGSSINLRSVGEGTTLVLINGRRMALGYESAAVDISALPLSAVERVEVVMDGASAIYGSDAVGGVVNFVLRDDYDGAETRLLAGVADGTNEYRASQVWGTHWESGNIVASGEYYHRDLLRSSSRDLGTDTGVSTIGSLLPRDNNRSLMLSGKQRLTQSLELYGDALYSDRDSFNIGTRITPVAAASYTTETQQLSSALGLGWDITESWRVDGHVSHGSDRLGFDRFDSLSEPRISEGYITFDIDSIEVKADGPVFTLPGGAVRAAVAATRRMEQLRTYNGNIQSSGEIASVFSQKRDRDVNSIAGEVLLPLVGQDNAVSLVRRLELSAAVRYDDYSDFGSSTDPRLGLAWEPVSGLRLRGSWGTSYLAPKISAFDVTFNAAFAFFPFDNTLGRPAHLLGVQGNAVESLMAQESENYTIGLEWTPESVKAKFSLGYYDIDYRNRISNPPSEAVIIADPEAYAGLIFRNPTLEEVNRYIGYGAAGQGFFAYLPDFQPNPGFDPASVELIVDLRRRNMSVTHTNGIDLSAQYDLDTSGGQLHFALDGTYILELVNQTSAASTPIDQVNTFANPPHLRLRAQVGYRRGGWAFNGFLHYKNAYDDNRFEPTVDIASWTTVDANVSYRFADTSGLLAGGALSLGATNLFDTPPPRTVVRPNEFDLGFDPMNASALGRLVSLDLTKKW